MKTLTSVILLSLFVPGVFAMEPVSTESKTETASFAGGCFWCTEAFYEMVKGVKSVVPGYQGGQTQHPTYKQICTGRTGHAEVVKVDYDPSVVSYEQLLDVFFMSHDPTQLNRQGADIGTQYRSAIFPKNEGQRKAAEARIKKLNDEKAYKKPVVTTVEDWATFYPAEAYHNDYFRNNPRAGYCQFVIAPKLKKADLGDLKK